MTEKTNNQKRKREGLASPFSSFHLEANRTRHGMTLIFGGIIGISDFSDTTLELKSHGGRVLITGKLLSVCVYENNNIEISGKVEDIKFAYGKN